MAPPSGQPLVAAMDSGALMEHENEVAAAHAQKQQELQALQTQEKEHQQQLLQRQQQQQQCLGLSARAGRGGLVKAHLRALVDSNPDLKELLEEHGGPDDAHDQYKTLLDIKTDMERDISIFAGAIQLLADQHDDAGSSPCCTVCLRQFESQADLRSAQAELDNKIRATEDARDKSRVVERYQLCKLALNAAQHGGDFADAMEGIDDASEGGSSNNSITVPSGSPRGPTEMVMAEADSDAGSVESGQPALDMCQRVAFNIRTGQLTELRNQKAENLQDQRCFACQRDFSGPGLAEYLRTVDRRAYAMSERLHHFVN